MGLWPSKEQQDKKIPPFVDVKPTESSATTLEQQDKKITPFVDTKKQEDSGITEWNKKMTQIFNQPQQTKTTKTLSEVKLIMGGLFSDGWTSRKER